MKPLSKRMQALADQVSAGTVFSDIGTDHGFLPIYLVSNDIIKNAIAMDVRPGPLSRAKEHVAEAGLNDRIELRLSDGLEKLEMGEADSILISGMGGPLMQRILSDGKQVAHAAKELILQPQSEICEFRHFLTEEGYVFLAEDAVYDEGKYYFLMKVVHATQTSDKNVFVPKEDIEFAYGGLLIQQKNATLLEYLLKEKEIWETNLESLQKQPQGDKISARINEISEKLNLIEKTISKF